MLRAIKEISHTLARKHGVNDNSVKLYAKDGTILFECGGKLYKKKINTLYESQNNELYCENEKIKLTLHKQN